uniref:kelch-like ECH-associated protein 1 n=1 Tax=Myxine glutinosa TaxID=7769 RepID=UPI00358FDFB5
MHRAFKRHFACQAFAFPRLFGILCLMVICLVYAQVMQRLVEAAYTARLSVGERCVLAVLQAAAMYHMESVVRVCTHFLKEQLDPSNAIGIAALAESLGCHELHHAARHYIYRKFSEVCQHEEFLSLPHCQLVGLISRDELSVRCESEVFNACLTWARHDLPMRHPYMYAVLSAVRCHSLTPSFLQMQLQRCDELRRNSACTRFLWRVFRELTLHQPLAQPPRSRVPAVPQLLYAVGGYLRHSLPIMEAFDTRTSNWLTLPKLPCPMSGLAVSVVGGLLYALGGRNNGPHGNEDSSALFCYNPVCNEWAELSHMGTARNRVAAAVIDGQIYAMGGSHGVLHHASVDRYNPELDAWTSVSPMSVARVGLGAAVLHRLIYAIGGFDGEQRLASAEVYHPENATWLPLASMSTVRSGAGVVALGEYVFALGGYDGEHQLSSMERYDPRTSRWEVLAPMLHTRSALAACTYNEHIYALGGYDGQTFLPSMERYDPVADRWEEVATMATGRSGAGLAVTMEPCLSRSETF